VIKGLFFDAAGTLIEPSEEVAAVYSRVFRKFGWPDDQDRLKQAFRVIFREMPEPDWAGQEDGDVAERLWWRDLVARTLTWMGVDPLNSAFEAAFAELFDHYARPEAWSLYPEVREVLETSRAAGLRMVVLSNFDRRLHRVLAGHGLEFEMVLTSADVSARKPAPDLFHEALRRTGLTAAEVRHVGDSALMDGKGAALAGIEAFVLDRPHHSLRDFLSWAGVG
jgi:putative hydrolase of the HAD superfamily